MYTYTLLEPKWHAHLQLLIRAQGMRQPPKDSTTVRVTNRQLAIRDKDGLSLVFRPDIIEWIEENDLSIRLGELRDQLVAYGDETEITLFTLAWL